MKRLPLAAATLLVSLALGVRPARAQVNITPGPDAAAFASSLGMTTDQLTSLVTGQLDGLFQVTNVNSFLRDFQNAQSFSSKGLGVDYASEATLVEVGATNRTVLENAATLTATINVWDYDTQSSNLVLTATSLSTNLAGVSITATNVATATNAIAIPAARPA